jgi:hypothetical protein
MLKLRQFLQFHGSDAMPYCRCGIQAFTCCLSSFMVKQHLNVRNTGMGIFTRPMYVPRKCNVTENMISFFSVNECSRDANHR